MALVVPDPEDLQNGAGGITQGRVLACCVPGPPGGGIPRREGERQRPLVRAK